jgi:hypothetical protein
MSSSQKLMARLDYDHEMPRQSPWHAKHAAQKMAAALPARFGT